jgi:hypothetical protein
VEFPALSLATRKYSDRIFFGSRNLTETEPLRLARVRATGR